MATEVRTASARPLDPKTPHLPDKVQDILDKGKRSWLKSTEVSDLLIHHAKYNLKVAKEAPCQPPGGAIFLFDRKAVRFFRKDSHNWRKKADGKTVRETHEKLKVGNIDMLNCYYAHADREDGLQRRCYWLLESEDDIVLVHYLNIPQRQHSRRTSTRLQTESLTRCASLEIETSMQSDPETSDNASRSSDLDAAELPAVSPLKQQAAEMPDIPPPDVSLNVPCLSTMSFDAFLAAMDPKNDLLPVPAGSLPAQEVLQRWNEEHQLAGADTLPQSAPDQAHRHSSPSSNDAQSAVGTQDPSAISATWISDAQVPASMYKHVVTAASWLERGPKLAVDEGSAHMQQLASMLKQTASCQEQAQIGPDATAPYEPQAGASASEFLPDKELSWSLSQHQRQRTNAQVQLPAYSPSRSAACAFLQATHGHQLGPHVPSDLLPVLPKDLLHGRHTSAQMPLSTDEQLQNGSQALGMPLSHTALDGMQGQSMHDYPSNSGHSDVPLVSKAIVQELMAGHLEPLAQSVSPDQQAAPSHRHAFERPNGLTSFAMPFMNAPHSSLASARPSAPAQHLADSQAVPMDVSQDHSLSSVSTSHPDVWPSSSASFAEQAVQPHLKPPVILISQAHGTVGEYARPPHKVSLSPFAIEKASPPASLDGSEVMQTGLRQTSSAQGVRSAAGLPQRPSNSDAVRKAALSLNAQLAQIDKQVLQHVMPQSSNSQHRSPDVNQQIHACKEQLRQLELTSQHLVQLSLQETASLRMTSSNASEPARQSRFGCLNGRSADQQPDLQRLSQSASSQRMLYDSLTCGPSWSPPNGGTQILIAASVMENRGNRDVNSHIRIMFDQTEVQATPLWPGVWRCDAPAHAIGTVDVCLIDGYGRRCSNSIPFQYQQQAAAQHSAPRLGSLASQRELQLQLVHALLQQQPTSASSSDHFFATSLKGAAVLQDDVLLPPGQASPGVDREEIVQILVQMELGALLSEVSMPAKNPRTIETGQSARAFTLGSGSQPAAVSMVSEQGMSLLHLVCALGYEWATRMLLRHGADPELQGPDGYTALHWAASRGHEACVTSLLARGADPNALTHPSSSSPPSTSADLASQAGHLGIAAFVAETSLVRGLSKLKRAKPDPLQHHASTPLPHSSPLLRKRSRLDQIDEASPVAPEPSFGLTSLHAPQPPPELPPMAPGPDQVLDSLAEMEHEILITTSALQAPTGISQGLATDAAAVTDAAAAAAAAAAGGGGGGGSGGEVSQHGAVDSQHDGISQPGAAGKSRCNPVALAAAAMQAAGLLEQGWQKREQHLVMCAQRRSKQRQREEAALCRLNDSAKMWAMLKRIAHQECSGATGPAPNSVTLHFLSLAPRVASLNAAVRAALCEPLTTTPSLHGDPVSSRAADGSNISASAAAHQPGLLPATRSAPWPHTSSQSRSHNAPLHMMDHKALSLAVHHVEAMVGNPEACSQYDRLKAAVRATRSQTIPCSKSQTLITSSGL